MQSVCGLVTVIAGETMSGTATPAATDAATGGRSGDAQQDIHETRALCQGSTSP